MAKVTFVEVPNPELDPTGFVEAVNENLSRIEDAIDNTVSRDGTAPNQMEADLDLSGETLMNGFLTMTTPPPPELPPELGGPGGVEGTREMCAETTVFDDPEDFIPYPFIENGFDGVIGGALYPTSPIGSMTYPEMFTGWTVLAIKDAIYDFPDAFGEEDRFIVAFTGAGALSGATPSLAPPFTFHINGKSYTSGTATQRTHYTASGGNPAYRVWVWQYDPAGIADGNCYEASLDVNGVPPDPPPDTTCLNLVKPYEFTATLAGHESIGYTTDGTPVSDATAGASLNANFEGIPYTMDFPFSIDGPITAHDAGLDQIDFLYQQSGGGVGVGRNLTYVYLVVRGEDDRAMCADSWTFFTVYDATTGAQILQRLRNEVTLLYGVGMGDGGNDALLYGWTQYGREGADFPRPGGTYRMTLT